MEQSGRIHTEIWSLNDATGHITWKDNNARKKNGETGSIVVYIKILHQMSILGRVAFLGNLSEIRMTWTEKNTISWQLVWTTESLCYSGSIKAGGKERAMANESSQVMQLNEAQEDT